MTNSFYNPTGNPAPGSSGLSAPMRAEFVSISTAFNLMPTLAGNAGKAVVVNGGGTGLTVTVGQIALAGNLTTTGAFNTTLIQGASVSLTLPLANGTLALLASPAFTGAPEAPTVVPTASAGTTQLATTAFVRNGTTTNDDALAGQVGEYVSSTVLVSGNIPLVTGTPTDVTSISLTAGDWEVSGLFSTAVSGAPIANIQTWISATPATVPTLPNDGAYSILALSSGFVLTASMPTGPRRFKLSVTTTIYLTVYCGFASGSVGAYGFIGARRMR